MCIRDRKIWGYVHKEGSPIKRSHRNQRGSREVSVFSHYGPAPAVVFRNPNLSPGAKAVYGYLCTFVNSDEVRQGDMKAWPSRRRMERELGISSNTLSKYLRELRDHALIKIQRTRVLRDGRVVYGNNLYILQASVILVDDHGGSAQSSHVVEMISHSAVSYTHLESCVLDKPGHAQQRAGSVLHRCQLGVPGLRYFGGTSVLGLQPSLFHSPSQDYRTWPELHLSLIHI